MDEKIVIEIIKGHITEQFPLTCPCCQKEYTSVKQYLQETTHLGDPISHDAEINDWTPREPIGTYSLAQCTCGTTLSISSEGMRRLTMWRLMFWAKRESARRGIAIRELLADLRGKIDVRILKDDESQQSPHGG